MDIRTEKYYETARKGSLNRTHPSFTLITKYGSQAKRILDIGCGEGSRLNLINNKKAEKIGVDTSHIAISLAKKQYPTIKFVQTEESLPFPDSYFDFVYSAFVLEHTTNPKGFVKEAVRVLSPGGILLLVAPNFGSPNRVSPNNKSPRFGKFFKGVKKDLSLLFSSRIKNLDWQKVKPQESYTAIDADTTVEPHLLTLIKFLEASGMKTIKASSLWEMEQGFSFFQIPFRFLGVIGIPPFCYWGPHLLFIGRKEK